MLDGLFPGAFDAGGGAGDPDRDRADAKAGYGRADHGVYQSGGRHALRLRQQPVFRRLARNRNRTFVGPGLFRNAAHSGALHVHSRCEGCEKKQRRRPDLGGAFAGRGLSDRVLRADADRGSPAALRFAENGVHYAGARSVPSIDFRTSAGGDHGGFDVHGGFAAAGGFQFVHLRYLQAHIPQKGLR